MAPSKHKVKINVDLGEGYGNFKCGPDEELIPLIDHANVACGFHAGDPLIMQQTVRLCAQHSVAVGAHPGLPDIQGFGRREIKMTPEELTAMTRYQIGALQAFLDAEGIPLHHVKPHGVLYGMMYRDAEVCRAVYAAVPKGVPVFGLAGTVQERVAREMGLGFVAELYGDVKYNEDGTLVIDRKKKPWTPEETRAHVTSQVYEGAVTAVTGEKVDLPLGEYEVSLCCHSDSPGCMEIVKASRAIVDEFNAKTFS
ncbi:Lactam utilization protein lamB [Lasiodiplodia hormozganensis]|uniref:Lactam utilization protein lamB n=1 Tax=Lasiodiplodia hormozganensis TaxID=869390 RepID=A0AA39XPH5_9PEZI|nr:Lactam utilization protein lamB [Lasiodiplodia hormozganensis]